jgi:hypothetical protein
LKADAAGKDYPVIAYFSALSDYPDNCIDFKTNEAAVNKAIREAYKNMSVRLSFSHFIQILGDERAQNSRKISQKLMKEFSSVYQTSFPEASPHQIVKITEKFAQHGWMLALTYNSLIQAFGKNFESFSYRELATFNKSLSQVGLRQADIIEESVKKLTSFSGRIKEEGDAAPTVSKS